jgi:hypothetical protein
VVFVHQYVSSVDLAGRRGGGDTVNSPKLTVPTNLNNVTAVGIVAAGMCVVAGCLSCDKRQSRYLSLGTRMYGALEELTSLRSSPRPGPGVAPAPTLYTPRCRRTQSEGTHPCAETT